MAIGVIILLIGALTPRITGFWGPPCGQDWKASSSRQSLACTQEIYQRASPTGAAFAGEHFRKRIPGLGVFERRDGVLPMSVKIQGECGFDG